MGFWGKLWYQLKRLGYWLDDRTDLPALPAGMRANLSGLVASVFVREPNGSRTNLEHHLEQELILRHAKVVLANQKVGIDIIKQGEFRPLAAGVNCSFVGTLVVDKQILVDIENDEGETVEVDGVGFTLSFRLFGSDGSVLISGTAEEETEKENASWDEVMRSLASKAITYLDTTDVWASVVIPTTSSD